MTTGRTLFTTLLATIGMTLAGAELVTPWRVTLTER